MRDPEAAELVAVAWFILAAQCDSWIASFFIAIPGLFALLRSAEAANREREGK